MRSQGVEGLRLKATLAQELVPTTREKGYWFPKLEVYLTPQILSDLLRAPAKLELDQREDILSQRLIRLWRKLHL